MHFVVSNGWERVNLRSGGFRRGRCLAILERARVAFSFLPQIVLAQILGKGTQAQLHRLRLCHHANKKSEIRLRPCAVCEGLEIQAIGVETHKRHGEVAEARFLAKASSLGFGVAKPWGDERYDFILDSGHCFSRVQVKSTRRRASRGYTVTIASGTVTRYDDTEIDFLIAYISLEDVWYVIPVGMLKGRSSLHFCRGGRGKSRWEKYREGWCQMACPHDENGPSKIVTPRCCDKGPTRLPICPLKLLR